MNLYFVYLRQPAGFSDRRHAPFWEFGSFGRTGCHSKNLLHPRNSPLRDGDRLAFLQGGRAEIRISAITPPITIGGSTGRLEARWDDSYRPLRYVDAPIFINNQGQTSFPTLLPFLEGVRRNTYCGKVGSRFRSRTSPVEPELASEVLEWFTSPAATIVKNYPEAIQHPHEEWYRYAIAQNWADRDARQLAYRDAGGAPTTNLAGLTESKGKRGKRGC